MPDLIIIIPAQEKFQRRIQFICMYPGRRDCGRYGLDEIQSFFKELFRNDIFIMEFVVYKPNVYTVLTEQAVELGRMM